MLLKALILLFSSLVLVAEEKEPNFSEFSFETRENKNIFQVAFEYSNMNANTGALTGIGFRTSWDYALSNSFSLGINFSQAFSMKQQGSFLFSELSTQAKYALLGSFISHEKITKSGNKEIFSEKSTSSKILSVGVSINQIFFNATNAVYPATGFSPFLEYSFYLEQRSYVLKANYAVLYGNKVDISALFVSAGINFDIK